MENFIGAAALSAICGVTYVAYKHPAGYRRLSTLILAVLTIVMFTIALWDTAIVFASDAATTGLDPKSTALVHRNLVPLTFSNVVTAIVAGSVFYVFFLVLLPRILGLSEEDEVKRKDD
jgi:hypothetical protein